MEYWRNTYNPEHTLSDNDKTTLVQNRRDTLRKLKQKHDELVDKAIDEHAERYQIAQEFEKLLGDIKVLRSKKIDDPQLEKEEQIWQEILELRAHELGASSH